MEVCFKLTYRAVFALKEKYLVTNLAYAETEYSFLTPVLSEMFVGVDA